jgi:hypothetical protein
MGCRPRIRRARLNATHPARLTTVAQMFFDGRPFSQFSLFAPAARRAENFCSSRQNNSPTTRFEKV